MDKLSSPTSDEYAEIYAGYIHFAEARGDVLAALPKQIDEIKSALGNLSGEQALFRDAPKEWSIKEVMGHLNDVERVLSSDSCASHEMILLRSQALNRMIMFGRQGLITILCRR